MVILLRKDRSSVAIQVLFTKRGKKEKENKSLVQVFVKGNLPALNAIATI